MVLAMLLTVAFGIFGILATPTAQVALHVASARTDFDLNPYPTKPRVAFRSDGTFKITVFSDLHYAEAAAKDANSTRLMKRVLQDEMPDYVVINGDLITGDDTLKENATSYIDIIVAPLTAAEIPFSSSHGNHDNQVNITHAEEITREQQVAPLSYTRFAPPGVGGPEGPGNYWVPIYRNPHANSPFLILWFFDSRGGVSPQGTQNADWVDVSVVNWMAAENEKMEKAWGSSDKRSTLAFVHIPPHYIQAVQQTITPQKNPGLNGLCINLGLPHGIGYLSTSGSADPLGGSGSLQTLANPGNEGKDAPFWDGVKKNLKNLVAVVSGHNHGNEWCAREPTKDILFCYDKHSGYGGYGDFSWGFGVRNVVFHAPTAGDAGNGQPKVESWIRFEEGETEAHVWLNNSFGR